MSLAQKAARGAAWTIVFGLLARAIGVAGTLVMTHLIEPDVIGEVAAATIIVMIFSWVSNWGFGPYLIVKARGDAEAEVIWHVTVAHLVLGAIAMVLVGFVGGYFLPWFNAEAGVAYVPGMAVALGLRRISAVPEKVLVKGMHFRAIGVSMAAGETTYAVVTVLLAWRGLGGMSVVWGNIAQSAMIVAIMLSAAGMRSWTRRTRLSRARFRDMLRFGLPLAVESVAHNAARYCDNLMMSRYFGTGPMALYNMGYNLADIPAIYVGEQIGQVLLPSMSEMPPARRAAALERSTALLGLIIFPMAVGLAVVSHSLIQVALGPEWQGVAPLLTILAALSVFRPIAWTLSSYLEASDQTDKFMWLELGKLVLLFGGIWALHGWGIQAAAAAVGMAFGMHAIAGVWMVARTGPSMARMFIGFARPMLACAAMAAAALGARHGLIAVGVDDPRILLPAEIVIGALAYIPAAFVFAAPIARDFLRLLKQLRGRGGAVAPAAEPPAPPAA
ncbi:MAG: oligosaccharide flippase family protein [Kofleriaceae bacterium]|nr:oligosaccharide flippase family protein [Kofleriaceae bacterium]MCB9571631.1 oligosaccharide flippase family protein [Kofleriaceae bacterium]